MKIKCDDCVNYCSQLTCFMENCVMGEVGYCLHCPCNDCDNDCAEPEEEKENDKRPKFIAKKMNLG